MLVVKQWHTVNYLKVIQDIRHGAICEPEQVTVAQGVELNASHFGIAPCVKLNLTEVHVTLKCRMGTSTGEPSQRTAKRPAQVPILNFCVCGSFHVRLCPMIRKSHIELQAFFFLKLPILGQNRRFRPAITEVQQFRV